jgi:hypothetical protein
MRRASAKTRKCAICDADLGDADTYHGDSGTSYEGRALCEDCYCGDEACATAFYGEDSKPLRLSETKNETNGDFRLEWHATDAWRGYYGIKSSRYVLVDTEELLACQESQTMMVAFDKVVRELFQKHRIDYVRVFSRTSNVFCQNFYLFAKKSQAIHASVLVGLAKKKVDYDDPKWGRGILFDEAALDRLSALFPEESIKTDADAVKLVEKHGEKLIPELTSRLRGKHDRNGA